MAILSAKLSYDPASRFPASQRGGASSVSARGIAVAVASWWAAAPSVASVFETLNSPPRKITVCNNLLQRQYPSGAASHRPHFVVPTPPSLQIAALTLFLMFQSEEGSGTLPKHANARSPYRPTRINVCFFV